MKKALHYINQFFGSVGGEDEADFEPIVKEGPVGPGVALQAALNGVEITHTVICGDNFMASHRDEAIKRIEGFLEGKKFDIILAGPAFRSGRYGMGCGEMCKYMNETHGVTAITSMHDENPGVDAYRENSIYIMKGSASAAGMRQDIANLAVFANKIIAGEKILWAEAEGYFSRGIRKEVFVEKTSADRVVDMLLAKIAGEPFETEYKIEVHDAIKPAKSIDTKKGKIAIISTGGLVPTGNPDRMPSGTASIWKRYDLSGLDTFKAGEFLSVHGGFSTNNVNADPEVLVPLSAIKELEKEGDIGTLHPYFYSTTGNLTALKEARRMGGEIAETLKNEEVDGVIFVSTWGSCTRCGATMVKEIDKAGIPVAHITNMTPVAKVTGSNRIIPGVAITNPCSDVDLPIDEQKKMRKNFVARALKAISTDITEQTFF